MFKKSFLLINFIYSVSTFSAFAGGDSFTHKTLDIFLGESTEDLEPRIAKTLRMISSSYSSYSAEALEGIKAEDERDRLKKIAAKFTDEEGQAESLENFNTIVSLLTDIVKDESALSATHHVFNHGVASQVSFAYDMLTLLEEKGILEENGQITTEHYLLRDPKTKKSFENKTVPEAYKTFDELYQKNWQTYRDENKDAEANVEDTLPNILDRVPFKRDTKVLLHAIKDAENELEYAQSFVCLNPGLFGGATLIGSRNTEGSFALSRLLDIRSDFATERNNKIAKMILKSYFDKRLDSENSKKATKSFIQLGKKIADEARGKNAGTIVQVAFPRASESLDHFYASEAVGAPLVLGDVNTEESFSGRTLTTFMDQSPQKIEKRLAKLEGNKPAPMLFHTKQDLFNPQFGNVTKVQARWLWEKSGEDVKVFRHRMFSYSANHVGEIQSLLYQWAPMLRERSAN